MKFWAFIVGAAPLGPALEDYWKRLGFVVIQGYGLTETAPIVTMNHPFKTNTGSVGKPIAGVEVKIAEDGEILVRGRKRYQWLLRAGIRDRRRAQGSGGLVERATTTAGCIPATLARRTQKDACSSAAARRK